MKLFIISLLLWLSIVSVYSQTPLLNALRSRLDTYNQIVPSEKVYVQCDRPMYKPGDDIWMALWLVNGITHQPSDVSGVVYVELLNPQGNVQAKHRLLVTEGRATCDFQLDSVLAGGLYRIKAYTNWLLNFGDSACFQKEIQVQDVQLPRLLMKLEFDRKAYGAGDSVKANLKLNTIENRALINYDFSYSVKLNGEDYLNGNTKTNEKGNAIIQFALPRSLTSNDGILGVTIKYRGTGESVSRSIPIVLNDLDLQFMPEGGDLVCGAECNVAFKALNEFGKPADVEGTIFNKNHQIVGQFKSYHQGMGAFKLNVKTGEKYYALIDKPQGVFKLYPLPDAAENGYVMEVADPLLFVRATEKTVGEIQIWTTQAGQVQLMAQVGGKICYSQSIAVKHGNNIVKIPLDQFPAGVAQFTLFTKDNLECCERLVYVKKHRQLRLNLTTDKPKYGLREEVTMHIKATSDDGKPVATSFGLAVVDDKLLSIVNDKSDNILSYLQLSSVLTGKIEEPNFYFDTIEAKADTAIDYLLLTQGWRRFTWVDIASKPAMDWNRRLDHYPEKRIVCGKVNGSISNILKTKLYIEETGQTVILDTKGYYEIRNLDLITPKTLVAVSALNDTIRREIKDYSSATYLKESSFFSNYEQNQRGSGKNCIGNVVDEKGIPLVGCTVYIKGTSTGTLTDIEGRFSFVTKPKDVIVFSLIGFKTIELPAGDIKSTIVMSQTPIALDEIVVVGYGIERRRSIVYGPVAHISRQKNFVIQVNQENTSNRITKKQIAIEKESTPSPKVVYQQTEDINLELSHDEINDIDEEISEDGLFLIVEQMPEFPGGTEDLKRYLIKNIHYPEDALNNGIQGVVYVRFVINREGIVQDVNVVRGLQPSCDAEAIRIVQSMPRWKPGMQRGRGVSVSYVIPVRFVLSDNFASRGYHQKQESVIEIPYYRAREFYQPKYETKDEVVERKDFRKTIYWNPLVETDSNGEGEVRFYTSDDITTFKAIAEGISLNGEPGRSEMSFFTTKELSVDVRLPGNVVTGDTLHIPVSITNKAGHALTCQVHAVVPDAMRLINHWQNEVELKADTTMIVYVNVVVDKPLFGELKVYVVAGDLKDGVTKSFVAESVGFPFKKSYVGNQQVNQFDIHIPSIVPNSLIVNIEAYVNHMNTLSSAVRNMLRMPHGCFEQVSSSTYPNIFALQYLKKSGSADSIFETKAKKFIEEGYKQLIKFETKEGGFDWFGQGSGHEGLTAYGLMEFNDMKQMGIPVDQEMIDRTQRWLLSRRNSKGGFYIAPGKYGFSQKAELLNNAYVVYALSEIGTNGRMEFEKAFIDNKDKKDAYRMALVANAAFNLKEKEKGNELINELSNISRRGESLNKLVSETSITGSRGTSLNVETVSLIALAQMKQSQCDTLMLKRSIDFLYSNLSDGLFGSTQSTVLALKAFTCYASIAKQELTAGTMTVVVNDHLTDSANYKVNQTTPLEVNNIERFMNGINDKVEVKFDAVSIVPRFMLNVGYHLMTPNSDHRSRLNIITDYNKTTIKMGETVRLKVTLTNKFNINLGMVIASIKIPSGLSVQPWQLKELSEKKYIDYYEIKGNQLYLYFRTLNPLVTGTINLDLKAEVPGTYVSCSSSAYEYYYDEVQSWCSGERIVVLP